MPAYSVSALAGLLILAAMPAMAAENKVKTQTIIVPSTPQAPAAPEADAGDPPKTDAAADARAAPGAHRVPDAAIAEEAREKTEPAAGKGDDTPAYVAPDIHYDTEALPRPVRRMREQIIEAAETGDVNTLLPVLQSNEMMPTLSLGDAGDPILFLKLSSGDPEGREILAILIEVLEAGYVIADQGTPQEMYIWPYFARYPLHELTPPQEVELYKLLTSADVSEMEEFGTYIFYRVGIGPDGTWHYFLAGE